MSDEKIMTIVELEEIIKAAPDKSLPVISNSDYCYSGAELKDDRLELTENEDEYSEIKETKEDPEAGEEE